jgi:ubiquinone/menaquinone biosynthesis C-methylase UbiE
VVKDAYFCNVDGFVKTLNMTDTAPLIPVANSYGWTSTIPNPMTCNFIDLIRCTSNPKVIDIGAGLGVGSIPSMEAGAYVIVNDINQSQLDHIADVANEKGLNDCYELLNAALPNLPELNQLDAIHASNVLHFLSGAQLVQAAEWMNRALKAGGKAFLQMQSPYCGHFHDFLPEYEKRKAAGLKWPGEMEDSKKYAAPEILDLTVDFNHVLEAEIVSKVFQDAGFAIEYSDYYTRPGLPDVCKFDGRENLGVIAVKNH